MSRLLLACLALGLVLAAACELVRLKRRVVLLETALVTTGAALERADWSIEARAILGQNAEVLSR